MADQISELKEGEAVFFTFPNSGVMFQRVPKDIMDKINEVVDNHIDTNFENAVEAGYKLLLTHIPNQGVLFPDLEFF